MDGDLWILKTAFRVIWFVWIISTIHNPADFRQWRRLTASCNSAQSLVVGQMESTYFVLIHLFYNITTYNLIETQNNSGRHLLCPDFCHVVFQRFYMYWLIKEIHKNTEICNPLLVLLGAARSLSSLFLSTSPPGPFPLFAHGQKWLLGSQAPLTRAVDGSFWLRSCPVSS